MLRLTAERLGAALAGSPLVRAELRWPSLAGADLVGATLREAVAYGKHLLLRFDDAPAPAATDPAVADPTVADPAVADPAVADPAVADPAVTARPRAAPLPDAEPPSGLTLHAHLRMDGSWDVRRTGSREAAGRSAAVRAVLATDTWTCLGWRLGMLDLVRTRDEGALVGHLGPDVLSPGFATGDGVVIGARGLAVEPGRAVCAALLDQRAVAGLGTIWMAETLFAERLWPWTRVGDLDEAGRVRLLRTAARLIGGSVTVGRRSGLGAVERRVHGRHHRPCARCGTPIALGSTTGPEVRPDQGAFERVVYWCPSCQRPR
ncbi:hypothetical protein GCM10007967_13210 [Xylanimonas ulmi]|uniref:DNA-(apurinic or apyrimidinic site) lyase n=1 Tax=Xylanimonas ulmi TaxID=228973 RepID=A0A4V2EY08_9MICO|nr:endonuclease-8 [Xylanibacterium ulmi]